MQYTKYIIKCEFSEDVKLNPFKGSALRGAFGHALKKAVCTVQRKDCKDCILNHQCLFAKLFIEQKRDENSPSSPFPYILEPLFADKNFYSATEEFAFSLTLFGDIWERLPFVIYAFEIMGDKGIGKSKTEIENNRANAPFSIKDVIACHTEIEESIYNASTKKLLASPSPARIELKIEEDEYKAEDIELKLIIESPLRFKSESKFEHELDFVQLFKLMLRRVSTLLAAYSDNEEHKGQNRARLDLDYHELLKIAENVKTIDQDIKWEDTIRYSNRQQTKMKFGGIIGTATYLGNISPFIKLLDLATLLHLGKQTSFGLGKISYSIKTKD